MWICIFFINTAFSQDCGCIDCPVQIQDQSISIATFVADGAENNSLTNNKVNSVYLKFNHSYPAELEMKLVSPAGQAVTLIGPQGSSASAIFFGGFDISFVSDALETSPDPGMSNIWNNEDLSGLNQYVGAYLPHSGSLQNFNTGLVNGDWTLEITDPLQFDIGELLEFNIIFEDQSGIDCCEANAGEISQENITACPGAEVLLLDIVPTYTGSPPSTSLYEYIYLISSGGVLFQVTNTPDLRMLSPGSYEVYGLSYEIFDAPLIPSPNGTLSISNIQNLLSGESPLLCGELTESFLLVEILDGNTETTIQDTICEGTFYTFGEQELFRAGEYRDTFSLWEECDSVVILNLTIGLENITYLTDESCDTEQLGLDTLVLTNEFNCDSLVVTETFLLNSDTICLNEETCIPDQDGILDTLTISTLECDSILITTFFFEEPDTIFVQLKSCFTSEVGLDTLLFVQENECDDVQITETSLYQIDTLYFTDTICDSDAAGVFIELIATDSCDRVEITTFEYIDPDTTYLSITTCDASEAGVDTFVLENYLGCDSLIITELIFADSNTTNVEFYSCDIEDVGVDTIILQNQYQCDSFIINTTLFSVADTMYLEELTCDISQIEPSVQSFETETCDSIIITSYIYSKPDTSVQSIITCDLGTSSDTSLYQNQIGCDSLAITNFIYGGFEATEISSTTCIASEVGVLNDTIPGQFCDSIIITTFTLLDVDTIYTTIPVCEEENVRVDTTFLTNENGCDNLLVSEYVLSQIEPIEITSTTCDVSNSGLDTLILSSQAGCDSLIITDYEFVQIEPIQVSITTCNPLLVGPDTLVLMSVEGCDSLIITSFELIEIAPTVVSNFTCDNSEVGIDSTILSSVNGCDSLLIEEFIFSAADTTYLPQIITCNPLSIGSDTTVINTNTCDSIVILSTIYSPLDTTFIFDSSCDISTTTSDTLFLNSIDGCDSIIVEIIQALSSSESFIEIPVTDPSQVAVDTVILQNINGCDSLAITSFYLETFQPDTMYVEVLTCDQNLAPDTSIVTGGVTITVPTLIIIDTTFVRENTCDLNQNEDQLFYFTTPDGCDSIVQVSYDFIMMDTLYVTIETCEDIPIDTIIVNGVDCPTLQVNTYIDLSSDTTFIERINCTGPYGIIVTDVLNSNGCDSTIVLNTIEGASTETIFDEVICTPNVVNDTLILEGENCDSLIITNYIYQEINSTIIEVSTCDNSDLTPDTIIMSSEFDCDSLIITQWTYEPLQITQVTEYTCEENLLGVFSDTLTSVLACDSIVVTEYLPDEFGLDFFVDVEASVCEGIANGKADIQISHSEVVAFWLFDSSELLSRSDLLAGEYLVQLSQGACDTLVRILVPEGLGLEVELNETYVPCSDIGGIIEANVISDNSPFTYLWSDGIEDSIRIDLPNGLYTLTVTDALKCTGSVTVEIDNVTGLDFSADIEHVSCYGFEDGAITIDLLSGTEPYTVNWEDGSTALSRENLPAGIYSVTINDVNDCSVALNRVVREPDLIVPELIVNKAQEFEVLVTGGMMPYTYLWNDGTTTSVVTSPIQGFAYEVTITDAKGCIAVIGEVFQTNSANDLLAQSIEVYPNPSFGTFYLSSELPLDLIMIKVYNIGGQEVLTQSTQTNGLLTVLDLNTLQQGAYILEAHFEEGLYRHKIILVE